jgi:hypothetical protein
MSVEGENFTDRVQETKRLKLDFENGINVILVSPRRMGKSSIVKKVKSEITDPAIKVIFMDIYDCRSEYDFYNRFASVLMKETATKTEQIFENIKRFLVRLTPKIAFSPEPLSEISLSLGITPQNYQPEEILQLPELIAKEQGVHLVICIDEFQQIGEFSDSLTIYLKVKDKKYDDITLAELSDADFKLFAGTVVLGFGVSDYETVEGNGLRFFVFNADQGMGNVLRFATVLNGHMIYLYVNTGKENPDEELVEMMTDMALSIEHDLK